MGCEYNCSYSVVRSMLRERIAQCCVVALMEQYSPLTLPAKSCCCRRACSRRRDASWVVLLQCLHRVLSTLPMYCLQGGKRTNSTDL